MQCIVTLLVVCIAVMRYLQYPYYIAYFIRSVYKVLERVEEDLPIEEYSITKRFLLVRPVWIADDPAATTACVA